MMNQSEPNFLVFCTDQQRADHLGCVGNPVLKTPNIDRIAEEGVIFRHCYTSSPACMPARATMLTGLTNRTTGVRTNGISLPEHIPTLPGMLAEAGYRTHSAGKLHLKTWASPHSFDITEVETPEQNPERSVHWAHGNIKKSPDNYYGFQTQDMTVGHVDYIDGDYKVWLDKHHPGAFDLYRNDNPGCLEIDPGIHYNNWIADRAIHFLREHREQQEPFFLWCSFPDPHFPFAAVSKWAEPYRGAQIDLPRCAAEVPRDGMSKTMAQLGEGTQPLDQDYLRECILQTCGMISHVDEQVGRVLDSLAEYGFADSTVIVYISDHGDQLGEHGLMYKGCFPYDGHARIPFLVKVPRAARQGHIVDDVVSMLDLVPTILDLADVAGPDDPLINDMFRTQAAPLPPALPGESLKPVLLDHRRPRRRNALVEFDDELQKAFDLVQMRMLVTNEYKLVYYAPTAEIMLFNRQHDPEEMKNLAGDSTYTPVVKDLLAQLLHEISRTEDRLPRRFSHA